MQLAKAGQDGSMRVGAERAQVHVRSRFNPIRDLNPQRLVEQMDAFDAGYLREFAISLAAMRRRDDKLKTVIRKRLASIARNGWEILTVDIPEADSAARKLATRQVEALTYFYNNLTARDVLRKRLRGGAATLFKQMGAALLFESQVHEIVWRKEGKFYTADFHAVPLQFFEATTGDLRFLESEGAAYGTTLEPDNWLVTVDDDGGLGQASATLWMYKRLPLRDWLLFSSKFGVPFLHGETDATPGGKDWNNFVAALRGFYRDGSMVTSTGTKINPVEPKAGSSNIPQPDLVEWADRGISTLWMGSDLSTMSRGQHAVGSDAQDGEGEALEADDCAWISETLAEQVDRVVIEALFGAGTPQLAYVNVRAAQQKNLQDELKIDQAAVTLGFPITLQDFSERYNRPLPEGTDGTQLLATSAPALTGATEQATGQPGSLPAANARRASNGGSPASMPSDEEYFAQVMAKALGVTQEWLAPVRDLFAEMARLAKDNKLSDAAVLDFVERAAKRLPELFDGLNHDALASAMEAADGTAVIRAVTKTLRAHAKK